MQCLSFAELDANVEAAWANKDAVAKLTANNKRNLSTLRQKLRRSKALYEKDLKAYAENPASYDVPFVPGSGQFEGSDEEDADDDGFVEKKRKGKKEGEEAVEETIKPEQVEGKLAEVLAERGRKNVDRKKQIATLRKLFDIAEQPALRASISLAIVTSYLDFSTSISNALPMELFKNAIEEFRSLFALLDANTKLVVRQEVPDTVEEEEMPEGVEARDSAPITLPTGPKAKALLAAAAAAAAEPTENIVTGSIVAVIERLDDEFTKIMQNADQHTNEYAERLREESSLYEMIVRAQRYYERVPQPDSMCRTMLRRVEHIYFKNQVVNDKVEEIVLKRLNEPVTSTDSAALLHTLCTHLYKNANDRVRTRALLCEMYHHALHGRYFKARDLLLMSHLQETIHQAPISAQVLYNRAMVQLGLCAFRHGYLREAQQALNELEASSRIKELLAQGVIAQRFSEKNPEQEKLERLRQIPFHMHINQELIECVYLVSSMCLEVPQYAASTFDPRKRNMVSKPFRRVFDMIERQHFSGPPENTREHIVQASKALLQGDWKRCQDLILSIKIWNLMPEKASVLEMLSKRIQEEALRTYLFTYSNYYESLSLAHLSSMSGMSVASVHGIISKMIFSEELHASLDQVTGVLLLHRSEPSRLQSLALQYTDKLGQLVDSNERTFDLRAGPQKDDRRAGDKRGQGAAGRTGGQRQQYSGAGKDYGRRDNRSGYQDRSAGGQNRRTMMAGRK